MCIRDSDMGQSPAACWTQIGNRRYLLKLNHTFILFSPSETLPFSLFPYQRMTDLAKNPFENHTLYRYFRSNFLDINHYTSESHCVKYFLPFWDKILSSQKNIFHFGASYFLFHRRLFLSQPFFSVLFFNRTRAKPHFLYSTPVSYTHLTFDNPFLPAASILISFQIIPVLPGKHNGCL